MGLGYYSRGPSNPLEVVSSSQPSAGQREQGRVAQRTDGQRAFRRAVPRRPREPIDQSGKDARRRLIQGCSQMPAIQPSSVSLSCRPLSSQMATFTTKVKAWQTSPRAESLPRKHLASPDMSYSVHEGLREGRKTTHPRCSKQKMTPPMRALRTPGWRLSLCESCTFKTPGPQSRGVAPIPKGPQAALSATCRVRLRETCIRARGGQHSASTADCHRTMFSRI